MNVLAEKQKRIFEDGITDLERLKREKEFLILYKEMREKMIKDFIVNYLWNKEKNYISLFY